MEVDFNAVEGVQDYTGIPAGQYVCRIDDVRVGTTRAGDDRWSMRLVVDEGEYAGRHAAWDSLVFSTRGKARAKQVFAALGLPSSGKVKVEPADLHGRRGLIEVRPTTYTTPAGEEIRRNEVPYDGFRPLPGGPDAAPAAPEVPF